MRRFSSIFMVCAVFLEFILFQNAFGSDPIAIISSVDGTVEIQRREKQEWIKARLGEPLFEGDLLQTQDHSNASLLFSSGAVVTVQSKRRITLNLRDSEKTGKTLINHLSKDVIEGIGGIFSLQKKKETLTAIPGIRKKDPEEAGVLILYPRNSLILTSKPDFRWKTKGKTSSFAVSLSLKGMKGRLWNFSTDQTEIPYPADQKPLERGQTYFVKVENRENPSISEEVFFSVSEEKTNHIIEKAVKQMEDLRKHDPEGKTPLFILALLYKDKGLFHLALEALDRMQLSGGEQGFIVEQKLDILSRMGLWEEWDRVKHQQTASSHGNP